MSFLQPALLAALPLMALPIIIHLINQRRYQTLDWGAMQFLLAANRMSRGYARIRQWLILALRTLAIATLIFAAARPLAGGLLGLASGGSADAILVLLDRSPSMQQKVGGVAKLDQAKRQLVDALKALPAARWVLIESGGREPRELAAPGSLLESPHATGIAAPADIPAMLQAAHDYVKENQPGRTEVWLVSDLRASDWDAESGRWKSLRDAFLEFPQEIRFHLLGYESPAGENLAVRVTDVRRESLGERAELAMTVIIDDLAGGNAAADEGVRQVPLRFEIDGARSETTVELAGARLELKNHRIPLGGEQQRGWGRVTIPADSNPADDQFYFVFDQPPERKTAIVADVIDDVRPLALAAEISADRSQSAAAAIYEPGQLSTLPWEETALLLWQAPLPSADDARLIHELVDRGGRVIFFRPRVPGSQQIFGVGWEAWAGVETSLAVETWRGDQDLWQHSASGTALTVGKLAVRDYCQMTGTATALARLADGSPLLARVPTDRGGVYFCSTTVRPQESSLAADGVALYVAVQRAVEAGVETLGKARLVDAGAETEEISAAAWRQLAGRDDALSTEYARTGGAYADSDRLWAVNRPEAEDGTEIVNDQRIAGLFAGLDFRRVSSGAGESDSLVSEVWRTFLTAMLIAMVGEALLCLPRPATEARGGMNASSSLTFLWTPWSLAVSVLVVAAAAGLCWYAWRRSGYNRAAGALELLRLTIVTLIALLLNQPEWIEQHRPDVKPTVVLLQDASPSMATRDVLGESTGATRTRRETAEAIIAAKEWEALRERMNIVVESFSEANEDDASAGTDLYAPLATAPKKYENLLAAVMISDGDWTVGAPPVQAAARLRLAGTPVYAVAVGSPTRLPDVELLSLDAPTFGVAGKTVRIPVTIESALPRDYVAAIRLRTSDGTEIDKEVRIAAMGRTSHSFLWKPSAVGDYELTVTVPKHGDELLPDNNELSAPIAIREEKLRVLVVESYPRWEYRYLRNALSRDPGVEVSCLLFHPTLSKRGGGSRDYLEEFPAGLDELAEYDVVFLGDVGTGDGQLSEEDCRLLKGLIEHQASGLVFMPGWQGRQFTLLETELATLYPVVLDEAQPGGWGSRTPNHFELTESGRTSLLTKLADTPDENIAVWESLPGFQWYAPVMRARAGSEVLCVHQSQSNRFGRLPLLATRTFGAGKVLFMGSDGAWRWRKGVEDKYHYRFWGQVVRWMAYQRNMAKGETMRLYYTPDQPGAGQTLIISANVMESSGEPLQQGDVTARIVAPSGAAKTIRFRSTGDDWGAFAAEFTPEEPGNHAVALACQQTGALLETNIYVQGVAGETAGRPARPEVLEEIARVSRGKAVAYDNLGEIAGRLSALPDPPPAIRRLQLWSHPLAVALVVALLGIFWTGRKAAGMI